MGVYKDAKAVASGPLRQDDAYGTARDKVRWAMLRADATSPFYHPDLQSRHVMDSHVRRAHNRRLGRRGPR
jgi:hypothetical protein